MTREEKFNDYAGFVEKFKPKKTTDDCYTPPMVYEAVKDWACRRYGIDPACTVRPFWPGGDYEHFDYPAGAVVLDNPPFSCLAKIVRFYAERQIPYFLFAPALTALGLPGSAPASSSLTAKSPITTGPWSIQPLLPPTERTWWKLFPRWARPSKLPSARVPAFGGPSISIRPTCSPLRASSPLPGTVSSMSCPGGKRCLSVAWMPCGLKAKKPSAAPC